MKKKIFLVMTLSLAVALLAGCAGITGVSDDIEGFSEAISSDNVLSTDYGSSFHEPTEPSKEPTAPSIGKAEPTSRPTKPTSNPAEPNKEPAESFEDPIETSNALREDGIYTKKEDVGLYIHLYGKLPENFINKQQAQKLGWGGGSLEQFAPNKCIGGNRFGNYEELLPSKDGRYYTECDIDTLGAANRGAKRIVFSNDGLVYYTDNHYESFTLLYGDEDS